MTTYIIRTANELPLPTLGWTRDGRQVVQLTRADWADHCHNPALAALGSDSICEVAECGETDDDAIEVIGATETSWVRATR